MIDLNKETPTCSTLELTPVLAQEIYGKIIELGSGDKVFKSEETDYDYSNITKVEKEIERLISLKDARTPLEYDEEGNEIGGNELVELTSDILDVDTFLQDFPRAE